MTTFVIDSENSITAFSTPQDATGAQGERFGTRSALAELAANWPAPRLVEIWNSIPGVTPTSKFKDRKSAVGRIWKRFRA